MAELGRAEGTMPRAESSPAEDQDDAVTIIERLHRAGWSIGDVPLPVFAVTARRLAVYKQVGEQPASRPRSFDDDP